MKIRMLHETDDRKRNRWGIAFIVLAFGSLAITGCARSPQEKAAESLASADKYFEQDAYSKALVEYMNVLANNGRNVHALKRTAKIHEINGNFEQAAQMFFLARNIDPEDLELRIQTGLILLMAGKHDPAREEARFILEKDPDNEAGILLFADCAMSPEDVEEAKNHITKLMGKNEVKPVYLLALGNLEFKSHNFDKAEALFTQCLESGEHFNKAGLALANVHAIRGDSQKVEEIFGKLVARGDDLGVVYARHAEYRLRTGNSQSALELAEKALELNGQNLGARLVKARVLAGNNQFDECLNIVEDILAKNANQPVALELRARAHLFGGDPEEAIRGFEDLSTRFPGNADIHYRLALAYVKNGNAESAIENLNRCLVLNPEISQAKMMKADLDIRLGRAGNAIQPLNEVIMKAPEPRAYYLLAQAYLAQRQEDFALNVFNKIANSFTNQFQAHYGIGLLKLRSQDRDLARIEFEKTLSIRPDFMPALYKLTEMDVEQGQFEAARTRIEKKMEEYPEAAGLPVALARIALKENDKDKAESLIRKNIADHPDNRDSYLLLSNLYISQNKQTEAIANLKQYIQSHPEDAASRLLLGTLYEGTENYEEAVREYEALLEQNGDSVVALNNLAYLLSEKYGRHQAAIVHARKANALAPEDPFIDDTLGWIHFRMGQYDKALVFLGEAVQDLDRIKHNAEVLYHLGMAYYLMGDEMSSKIYWNNSLANDAAPALAKEMRVKLNVVEASSIPDNAKIFSKVLAEDPNDVVALRKMSEIKRSQKQYSEAEELLLRAEKVNEKATPVLSGLASLYLNHLKDYESARSYINKVQSNNPEEASVGFLSGKLAFLTGNYQNALSLLKQTRESEHRDPETAFYAGLAYFYNGLLEESRKALEQCIQLDSKKSFASQTQGTLASLRSMDGEMVDGELYEYFQGVLRDEPQNLPALYGTARIQLQNQRWSDADKTLRDIIGVSNRFGPGHKLLAVLLTRQSGGDVEEAYDHALQARAVLGDDDVELTQLLGKIACLRKDYQNSVRYFETAIREKAENAELSFYLGKSYYELKNSDLAKMYLAKSLAQDLPPNLRLEAQRMLDSI